MDRGRKRVRNEEEWQKNVRKRRWNAGEEYLNVTGRRVPAKVFDPSNDCCEPRAKARPKCTYKPSTIPVQERASFHSSF